jgi:hypothetical protein
VELLVSQAGLSSIEPVMCVYTALCSHMEMSRSEQRQERAMNPSPRPSIVRCLDTKIQSKSMPGGPDVAIHFQRLNHMFLPHINHEAATLHCTSIPIPLSISALDLTDNTPQ